MLLAACLLLVCVIGAVIDHYSSVTEVMSGEAEDVDLLISEICTKNTSVIQDVNGKYSDYIELYNRGGACNLRGFTVSDGRTVSEPFGDLHLAAGAYYVLTISRETVGFSLSSLGGETVTLRNRDGSIAAQVTTVQLQENQVMEWNGDSYKLSDKPTPGFPNTSDGYIAFTEGMPDESPLVVISELLTENKGTLPDREGHFSDVVELHNISGAPLSLAGYYLSDRQDNRFRYALPAAELPADGYLVIYCDGAGGSDADEIHANFSLSVGETLLLTAPNGKYTAVTVEQTASERSLALVDGGYRVGTPTPGFSNDSAGEVAFLNSRIETDAALVISEILLSTDGTPYQGKLCDVVEIRNRSSQVVDTAGWYLTDGEDLLRYALPSVLLQPNECAVVICDGSGADWHANFSISEGETVRLTGPTFRHGEPVLCRAAGDGKSLVREEGADGAAYRAGDVTIGYADTADGQKAFAASVLPEGLRISEVMTANKSYLRGSYGTCCDWVELYNASEQEISLQGWYLTDDASELRKGELPAYTLAPGEYYTVFLSTKTENLLRGYPVMPFGLSSTGDRLYLIQGDRIADAVMIPALTSDAAYGRPAGEAVFSMLQTPTPGAKNSAGAQPTKTPAAKTAQGVYNDVPYVDVELSGEGTLYYTTDCSVPTAQSPRYTGTVRLYNTTVLRVMAQADGKTPSEVLDLTYVINEGHTLAVASLVTTPENLWDYYTGIYETGPNAEAAFPHVGANYWQQWEKAATVSLFETDGGGFTSPCGIRIFGAYSRALAMKSFSCFFRSAYGNSTLQYPLFGDEGLDSYEAFLFRNTGQDFNKARMRDPLLTDLLASATDVAVQKNRPVVLYLNGEFWGVYYLREKINENYVAGNYNVSKDEVQLTRANGTSSDEYLALVKYAREHDLTVPEYYDYVASQVDIDEYIDYIVAEICICNTDNGNIKFFKTTNGKWTWIFYDVDQSSATANFDTVAEHLNPKGTGSLDRFSTTLINALLKNEGFRQKFLRRMAWQMQNIWSTENMLAAIDRYEQAIAPEMERDCAKWGRTYAQWQEHVKALRSFATNRPAHLTRFVQSYFHLTDAQMKDYGFTL